MNATESLQSTLAAEHAAIFLYGDAGAHSSQSSEPALFSTIASLYRTHRARRDQLHLLLADRGATPVAAQPAYDLPAPLATPAAVRAQAQRIERRCAEVYAALVAHTDGTDRAWAISALSEAAQARILLGGRAETFPGAPELSS
ncbi:MAG: hypothetical protein AVDCRST_MAG60-2431 [uncultured Nocardioides sp.]|uniref:DUF4439 domain-containing protein n=1 Tax=uncultured Nocardioides sp. TaxID=198441 RepID=A0A6J4PAE2_9ACTN|nr:MAG: hypothetical protein AVDCRST_MAG60-2431 [uncultured Nocardioides sp.]